MIIIAMSPSSGLGQSESNNGIDEALLHGTPHLSFRFRYEHVEDDSFEQHADALTGRLRLNYRTGIWRNFSAFSEFDYVGELFIKNFNSGAGTSSPNRNQYPVVADPKGADLNQLYVDYVGVSNTRVRAGRQRILLGDQRFVGGVGWRQNEQSYDGISVSYKEAQKHEIFYGFITQVNRIFGERSAAGSVDTKTHLLNAEFRLGEQWILMPYYYNIDNKVAASFSSETIGIKANSEFMLSGARFSLLASYAEQSGISNNPVKYNANYYHFALGWQLAGNLSINLGVETLGGDELNPGQAFRTPLATLHAFQGWADQFLATPDAGVSDRYLQVEYQPGDWSLLGRYHNFDAADGPAKWGSEVDLSASKKLNKRYSLLLKLAVFNSANADFSDVKKAWIQFVANY